MLKKVVMIVLSSLPLAAWHHLDLTINNHDLDVKGDVDVGQFNERLDAEMILVGGRYLYASRFHNDSDLQDDHALVDGHFVVQQRLRELPELTLGMGLKTVFTSISDEEFYAVPLGAHVSYEFLPGITLPIYLNGCFYYSPEVLSFSKAKNYLEYMINVDVMIIDRAGFTAGFRHIDTNYDLPDADLIFNESWFVGVKFRF